jgi:hypothetical protein
MEKRISVFSIQAPVVEAKVVKSKVEKVSKLAKTTKVDKVVKKVATPEEVPPIEVEAPIEAPIEVVVAIEEEVIAPEVALIEEEVVAPPKQTDVIAAIKRTAPKVKKVVAPKVEVVEVPKVQKEFSGAPDAEGTPCA